MYDYSKLIGKIIEVFGTRRAFAKAVNKTNSYLSLILTGKRNMNNKDVAKWADALGIPCSEIGTYFFTMRVDETQQ